MHVAISHTVIILFYQSFQECIHCEQNSVLHGFKIKRGNKVRRRRQRPNRDTSSADDADDDENAIEIIKTVTLDQAHKASVVITQVTLGGHTSTTMTSVDISKKATGAVTSCTTTVGGRVITSVNMPLENSDKSVPIIIPVSMSTKPSDSLPKWGLLPPVEEEEAREPSPVETSSEHKHQSPRTNSSDSTAKHNTGTINDLSAPHSDENEPKKVFPDQDNNNEILTMAYNIITENDDLLTALDKLEYHVENGTNPLESDNGNSNSSNGNHSGSAKNDNESNDAKGSIVDKVNNMDNHNDNLDKDNIRVSPPTVVPYTVTIPILQDGENTGSLSGENSENNLAKSESKSNSHPPTKNKESSRFIKALNWVSKLPTRLAPDKHGKKSDNSTESGDDEEYGFFIKLSPKCEGQGEVKSEPYNINTTSASGGNEANKSSGDVKVVTEVLSAFQSEVEDQCFQDNLKRYGNMRLCEESAKLAEAAGVTDSGNDRDTYEEQGSDDDWEPGPRQTGSLPNLASQFMSTPPPLERLREYIMQNDDSDDESLDEFMLIPITRDYASTACKETQPPVLNSPGMFDSEENTSPSDEITSPDKCLSLLSDANEKLPLSNTETESSSQDSTSQHFHSQADNEAGFTSNPREKGLGRPPEVKGQIPQFNLPSSGSPKGKKPSTPGGIPRAIKGSSNTPPQVRSPPRPIRGAGNPSAENTPRPAMGVTYTSLYAHKTAIQSTDSNMEKRNKHSVKDKLIPHGSKPTKPHLAVRTNPRLGRHGKPTSATPPGAGRTENQHQQPPHYNITAHKPTSLLQLANPSTPSFNSSCSNTGSAKINDKSGPSGESTSQHTPDPHQRKPLHVARDLSTGEDSPGSKLEGHKATLDGPVTEKTADRLREMGAGNGLEAIQDGRATWMDSGVQMDFADET